MAYHSSNHHTNHYNMQAINDNTTFVIAGRTTNWRNFFKRIRELLSDGHDDEALSLLLHMFDQHTPHASLHVVYILRAMIHCPTTTIPEFAEWIFRFFQLAPLMAGEEIEEITSGMFYYVIYHLVKSLRAKIDEYGFSQETAQETALLTLIVQGLTSYAPTTLQKDLLILIKLWVANKMHACARCRQEVPEGEFLEALLSFLIACGETTFQMPERERMVNRFYLSVHKALLFSVLRTLDEYPLPEMERNSIMRSEIWMRLTSLTRYLKMKKN